MEPRKRHNNMTDDTQRRYQQSLQLHYHSLLFMDDSNPTDGVSDFSP